MGTPGSCKAADLDEAETYANATKHLYAPMFVTIDKQVSATDIQFSIWGVTGSFTATWGDTNMMWSPCPSSLPSGATPSKPTQGGLPAVGAAGILYLSDTFLVTNKISETPKWPSKMLGEPLTAEIEVLPMSLQLTAVYTHNGRSRPATIELLDRTLSSREQTLAISKASPLKVRLTQKAFNMFGAVFHPGEEALKSAIQLLASGKGSSEDTSAAWKTIASAAEFLATDPDEHDETATSLRQRLSGLMLTLR